MKALLRAGAIVAMTTILPLASLAAQGQRAPIEKVRAGAVAVPRQESAASLRSMQIVTPVEIAFSDAESYDNFAAGRLPVGFVLRNPASGQMIRLEPRFVTEGFRPSADRSKATIYLVIGDLLAPVWDEAGCTETQIGTESAAAETGVTITLSYVPCASGAVSRAPRPGVGWGTPPNCGWGPHPPCIVLGYADGRASAQRTSGVPVPGIGIVVKKNPGGGAARVTISTGPSQTGEGVGQRLLARLRETGATNISVPDVRGKGAGSPKANGF